MPKVTLKAEELCRLAEGRGRVYKFLAAVYISEPSDEMIDQVLGSSFLENLAQIDASAQQLKDFAASFLGNYEDLRVEYDSLFVVPMAQYVRPYESAYRDGLTGDGITRSVRQYYHSVGGDVTVAYGDLPDHLAAELDFMFFLCENERRCWESGNIEEARQHLGAQKDFLEKHLLKWIPDLCHEIQNKTESSFYRALAGFTQRFITADVETVAELLKVAGAPKKSERAC